MEHAFFGDWVEIERISLTSKERPRQISVDTKKTPFKQWVRGHLLSETANIGDEIEIATLIGRKVKGTLCEINPKHIHGYGRNSKELLEKML